MSAAAEASAPATPQHAQLLHLASATDAQLDAGAAVVQPGQAEPPAAVDRGAELGAMLSMIVAIAAPALPFLPQCYTPDTCRQIGTAFAAVAAKYGWSLDFEAPELALAIVALPPTINAVALGRAHFAEKRRAPNDRPADQAQQLQQQPPNG